MATSWSSWYWHLAGASLSAIAGAIAFFADCAKAQIAPDDTLGAESSVVTPSVVINGITTNPHSAPSTGTFGFYCFLTAKSAI